MRGMDTMTDLAKMKRPETDISDFFLAGGSKVRLILFRPYQFFHLFVEFREFCDFFHCMYGGLFLQRGWTAWTTAAVDRRVFAISPSVISILNLQEVKSPEKGGLRFLEGLF